MGAWKIALGFCCSMLIASHANALIIGWFTVDPEAVSESLEDGRVLRISDLKFNEITKRAKIGDRVKLDGTEYEIVVVVPGEVLTVLDVATRTEMRVLVKALPRKK